VPFPSSEIDQISLFLREFCDDRVPPHAREQVQLDFHFDRNSVTLVERRPPWDGRGGWTESNIAKFRYFVGRREWRLYCRSRNGRWRQYPLLGAAARFETLLSEVDEDPICIFWG